MILYQSGIGYFKIKALEDAGIFHAFITRHLGSSSGAYSSLNMGLRSGDDPVAVSENESAVRKAFAIPSLVRARQVHGNNVIVIDKPVKDERAFLSKGADVLITDQAGVALAVLTADCFPVIIVDTSRPAIAMIHVGRKGVCKKIIESAVKKMMQSFGSMTDNMIAGVGPGIGPCCYHVDENIARDFKYAFSRDIKKILHEEGDELYALDLFAAIQLSLAEAGVRNIERLNLCTSCRQDLFFSNRRDKGITGRQINLVMIPEKDYHH